MVGPRSYLALIREVIRRTYLSGHPEESYVNRIERDKIERYTYCPEESTTI